MNEEIDYDPRLAATLSALLARDPLGRRLARRPANARRASALVLAGATALVLGGAGLGVQINAVAESQGASCLDGLAKINLFARDVAESVRGLSAVEQRPAKARVAEYAQGVIAANCQGADPGLLEKTGNGVKPLPTPSVDGPLKSPGAPYASGGAPKP
jgi:hypothetical protein